jgi:putative hydrolase of the HAD superfamily
MRSDQGRPRGRGVEVERAAIEDHRNLLRDGYRDGVRRFPVLRRGIHPGPDQPRLHPTVRSHGLGPARKHEIGGSAWAEVTHHPDPGSKRGFDAEDGSPGVLRTPRDHAENAARVLVVALQRHRDVFRGIRRRPVRVCGRRVRLWCHDPHDSLDIVALNIPDRVVVFDFGEVISLAPSVADREELLRIATSSGGDFSPEAFWAAYEAGRDALDHGSVDIVGYWQEIAAGIGAVWSPADLQRLWACDFRSWISVNPDTVTLLAELHAGGTRIALLSNAGFDFASPLRFSPMAQYFERMFISAEMDDLKPSPSIYLTVAAELGITMAEMIFIDNKAVNTDAAAALGATTHHFTGAARLRSFLETLAVPFVE